MDVGSAILLIVALLIVGPAILFYVSERVSRRIAEDERELQKRLPPDELS